MAEAEVPTTDQASPKMYPMGIRGAGVPIFGAPLLLQQIEYSSRSSSSTATTVLLVLPADAAVGLVCTLRRDSLLVLSYYYCWCPSCFVLILFLDNLLVVLIDNNANASSVKTLSGTITQSPVSNVTAREK